VHTENIEEHTMHSEYYSLAEQEYKKILQAKKVGRRIIAVGTTSARVLETVFSTKNPQLKGDTEIFIYPGYEFEAIDGLITNFHLPKSSLLMLVSALTGTELMHKAYQKAIAEKYRFYSYGDAMLIL
jgi:S-adenosylmethionine:tRNA ribosyltransferase-isomerase